MYFVYSCRCLRKAVYLYNKKILQWNTLKKEKYFNNKISSKIYQIVILNQFNVSLKKYFMKNLLNRKNHLNPNTFVENSFSCIYRLKLLLYTSIKRTSFLLIDKENLDFYTFQIIFVVSTLFIFCISNVVLWLVILSNLLFCIVLSYISVLLHNIETTCWNLY